MNAKRIGSAMLILAVVGFAGCHGKSIPTMPSIGRASQDFAQGAASVFGPDQEIYNNVTFEPHYHDVATCQIKTVGIHNGVTPGTPWSAGTGATPFMDVPSSLLIALMIQTLPRLSIRFSAGWTLTTINPMAMHQRRAFPCNRVRCEQFQLERQHHRLSSRQMRCSVRPDRANPGLVGTKSAADN